MTLETHAKPFLTFEMFDMTGTYNTSETYQMDWGWQAMLPGTFTAPQVMVKW